MRLADGGDGRPSLVPREHSLGAGVLRMEGLIRGDPDLVGHILGILGYFTVFYGIFLFCFFFDFVFFISRFLLLFLHFHIGKRIKLPPPLSFTSRAAAFILLYRSTKQKNSLKK